MTRSVGNCVHRGAGPNGKSPTPRAPPPAARGGGAAAAPLGGACESPARAGSRGGGPAATAGGPPRGEGCRRTPRNNKLQKKKNKRNFPNAAPATQDKCTNTHSLTHTRARQRQQPQLFFFLNQISQSPNKMVFQKKFFN